MSFREQLAKKSQKNSQQTKNKLNTAFSNGSYFKWKVLRKQEWWHCLSHKDLIIKSIKLTILGLFSFFDHCFENFELITC